MRSISKLPVRWFTICQAPRHTVSQPSGVLPHSACGWWNKHVILFGLGLDTLNTSNEDSLLCSFLCSAVLSMSMHAKMLFPNLPHQFHTYSLGAAVFMLPFLFLFVSLLMCEHDQGHSPESRREIEQIRYVCYGFKFQTHWHNLNGEQWTVQ